MKYISNLAKLQQTSYNSLKVRIYESWIEVIYSYYEGRCSYEILPNSLSTPPPFPPSSSSKWILCGNFFALIHQFLNTAVLTMAMDILTMTMVFYRRWTNFFAKIISPQNRCKNDQQQKYWSTESLFSSLQKITVLYVEKNPGRTHFSFWPERSDREAGIQRSLTKMEYILIQTLLITCTQCYKIASVFEDLRNPFCESSEKKPALPKE